VKKKVVKEMLEKEKENGVKRSVKKGKVLNERM
jgi:hypothetical protein